MLRRGCIVLRNGYSTIECVILDVSDGGARLKLGEWMLLPQRFELRIENGPARWVEVRFRDLETAGVRFLDEAAA